MSSFILNESSTTPIFLTERNHVPKALLLDFRFFQRIHALSIPIGMFYRDIHWRLKEYKRWVALYKRAVTIPCYWLEWFAYRRWVDQLFLPSLMMAEALPTAWPAHRISALPPGCREDGQSSDRHPPVPGMVRLFYVGGVTPPIYDIQPLVHLIRGVDGISLTICCPEAEWEKAQAYYSVSESLNISVVHASGDGLRPYYAQADVSIFFPRPHPYLRFAMPVKLFEAIEYGIPVIIYGDSEASRLVDSEGIGWSATGIEQLHQLLLHLQENPQEITAAQKRVKSAQPRHTWAHRARTAADVLGSVYPPSITVL
jgi:hypothetical protein